MRVLIRNSYIRLHSIRSSQKQKTIRYTSDRFCACASTTGRASFRDGPCASSPACAPCALLPCASSLPCDSTSFLGDRCVRVTRAAIGYDRVMRKSSAPLAVVYHARARSVRDATWMSSVWCVRDEASNFKHQTSNNFQTSMTKIQNNASVCVLILVLGILILFDAWCFERSKFGA